MSNTRLASLETEHAMDLARLDQACAAFFQACDAAGTDPSEEEQESLLRSFQEILAWRSEIDSAVRSVDGAIDLAAAKVNAALGPERSQRGQQVLGARPRGGHPAGALSQAIPSAVGKGRPQPHPTDRRQRLLAAPVFQGGSFARPGRRELLATHPVTIGVEFGRVARVAPTPNRGRPGGPNGVADVVGHAGGAPGPEAGGGAGAGVARLLPTSPNPAFMADPSDQTVPKIAMAMGRHESVSSLSASLTEEPPGEGTSDCLHVTPLVFAPRDRSGSALALRRSAPPHAPCERRGAPCQPRERAPSSAPTGPGLPPAWGREATDRRL